MKKQNQNSSQEISNSRHDYLFQTFYIFGIEPDDLDISDFSKEKNEKTKKYLHKNFKQLKILTKFPPQKNEAYEIDPYIIMNHCFSKGYKLHEKPKEKSQEKPQENTQSNDLHDEFFSFNLEKLNKTNLEKRRIYYSVAIIYEPLNQYLKIKYDNKIPSIKKGNDISLDNIYIRKCLCFSMVKPFPYESKILLKEILDYFRGNQITKYLKVFYSVCLNL